MIDQVIINADKRVYVTITDTIDAGVVVSVIDPAEVTQVSEQVATVDPTNPQKYYYDISNAVLAATGTYSIVWGYASASVNKRAITQLDVLEDDFHRYCYITDVKRKLYDTTFPTSFDFAAYTRRATMEMDRALQSLYVLPLAPASTHDNYQQDVQSILELASDIAAGFAIDDLAVFASNRTQILYNNKKQVAFAELNRYAARKKLFSSITKDTAHEDIHYDSAKPRIAVSEYQDSDGTVYDDPFNQVYDNFSPVTDNV